MIGGAYMLLLAKMQRSTDDVDILWLDEDDAFQRAIDALRESVQAVAEKQQLEPDWFNYMTHLLMYDVVRIPKGPLWKRFGPLHIYVPSRTYILALKILAGRQKDIEDSRALLTYVRVKTRQHARRKIFCGNRLYQNKYEMSTWMQEARAQGITDPGEAWCYARQKEISIHGG